MNRRRLLWGTLPGLVYFCACACACAWALTVGYSGGAGLEGLQRWALGRASASEGEAGAGTDGGTIGGCRLRFASRAEGALLLGADDDFARALSPFDLSARLDRGGQVRRQEFLAFAAQQALPWSAAERAAIRAALTQLGTKIGDAHLHLPAEVLLIKTTGKEEGDAAYTRGGAVILPQQDLDPRRPPTRLPALLLHELFHIISRHDPALRDRLYAVVDFRPMGGSIDFATELGELAESRITNPDAFEMRHMITVSHAGQQVDVVPILFATPPRYQPGAGRSFFSYLTFRLLALRKTPGTGAPFTPLRDAAGKLVLLEPATTDYLDHVGRNTDYIIHAEEVLAENFCRLFLPGSGKKPVQTPAILDKLRPVFSR